VHEDGLVRFATAQYTPISLNQTNAEMKNVFMHLTNYALNKGNSEFKQATSVDDDKSHKRTITKLLQHLTSEGKDTDSIKQDINDIIIKTMLTI
jgi:phosphoenolpyruvate carboxylase